MKRHVLACALAMLAAGAASAQAPAPGSDFFWDEDHEVAIARSAAPDAVSTNASVWVLEPSGYRRAVDGENGFNCLVLRQWSAIFEDQRALFEWDELVAPICYDPVASQSGPMQEQLLRARLGLEGAGHDDIRDAVFAAYAEGELSLLDGVAFAYMYSDAQRITPEAGHWHPHVMVYAPHYTNAMLGGNGPASGDPIAFEAPGTFRAVIAIPVNGRSSHIAPALDH